MKTFAEIPYARPDYTAVAAQMTDFTHRLKKAASYEEMKEVFFEKQKAMREPATMVSVCRIRADINTADPFYAEEKKFFNRTLPGMIVYENAWNQALLDSPFRADFAKEFGDRVFVLLENQIRIKDPVISAELVEESQLVDEYSKVVAACTVDFCGKKCNFYGLLAYMESTGVSGRPPSVNGQSSMPVLPINWTTSWSAWWLSGRKWLRKWAFPPTLITFIFPGADLTTAPRRPLPSASR